MIHQSTLAPKGTRGTLGTFARIGPAQLLSVGSLVLLCGVAVGQESGPQSNQDNGVEVQQQTTLRGSFDRPLGSTRQDGRSGQGGQGGKGGQGFSRMVISENNGEDSFSLAISGDEMKVKHNDEVVPADRLRRSADKVEVLDASGKVIHTFNIDGFTAGTAGGSARAYSRSLGRGGQGAAAIATPREENPPPVMVGMLMEFSEQESGLVVQRVFDGMPAQLGGVMAGDIITEVDGKEVTGNQSLRDGLRTRKPGDTVTLTVEREGETKELTLTLVKYDKAAMDQARGEQPLAFGSEELKLPGGMQGFEEMEVPDGFDNQWIPQLGSALSKDAARAIKRALSSIKENAPAEVESWRNEVIRELEEALAQTQAMSGEMRDQLRAYRGQTPRNRGQTLFFREMPGQVFVAPKAPTPPAPPGTPRSAPPAPPGAEGQNAQDPNDRLAAALERLNERLDKLEERLDGQEKQKNERK
jgi:hypothetical protein